MNFIEKTEKEMTKTKFKGCDNFLIPRVEDTDCGQYCKFCKRNHYCSECGRKFLKNKKVTVKVPTR